MSNGRISGVGVKATRSVPEGFSLDADVATPRFPKGWGLKPHPSSHMAANGFPGGEREGGIKIKLPKGSF